MDKENIISYGISNYRSKNNEIGILWNDRSLKIKWPIKKPIISKKDKKNPRFEDHI
jgi:dTDP-4-dehydrorhamnose 3,5-epimerase